MCSAAPWPSCGQKALSRELLAALVTAAVQDDATVLGRHAGAETVTASTHELGRLVSTLHDIKPRLARFLLFDCLSQEFGAHMERQAPTVHVGGVYRENRAASQRSRTDFLCYQWRLSSRSSRRISPAQFCCPDWRLCPRSLNQMCA